MTRDEIVTCCHSRDVWTDSPRGLEGGLDLPLIISTMHIRTTPIVSLVVPKNFWQMYHLDEWEM